MDPTIPAQTSPSDFYFHLTTLPGDDRHFTEEGIRVITCLVLGGRGDSGNCRGSSSSTHYPSALLPGGAELGAGGGGELGAGRVPSWMLGGSELGHGCGPEMVLRVGLSVMPVPSARWGAVSEVRNPHPHSLFASASGFYLGAPRFKDSLRGLWASVFHPCTELQEIAVAPHKALCRGKGVSLFHASLGSAPSLLSARDCWRPSLLLAPVVLQKPLKLARSPGCFQSVGLTSPFGREFHFRETKAVLSP